MNIRTTIALFFLLAMPSLLLHAQSADTILPNPKAVLLKRIWMVRGSSGGEERVGAGAAALGSVVKDSLKDFAVYTSSRLDWNVYAGQQSLPSTVPIQVFDSLEYIPPIVGNFRSKDEVLVGFSWIRQRYIKNIKYEILELRFHQVVDSLIGTTPVMVLDGHVLDSAYSLFPSSIQVADLNKDGDDDLVILFSGFLRAGVTSTMGEIWIYAGGPNFQVDSPTVVLKDTEANRIRYSLHIAQFDNDSFPDLLIAGDYEDNAAKKYKFFWGKPSLQQLSEHPDHSITLNNAAVGVGILPTIADLDGDHIADIAGSKLPFTPLFLSSSGKPITQRTFRMDDADHVLYTPNFYATGELGPLNDSTNQRTMLPLFGPSPLGGAMVKALSTNAAGSTTQQPIDPTYDAYYGSSYDGMAPYSVFGHGGPAGDVNGDGWSDYLTAEPSWPGSDAGIAMILAGGPYIPRDDNTTSVHDIPAEGKSAGLSVWPNPVRDLLNIAWRGDLQRMPRRFTVHSINGERIAGGMVDPGIGAAIWHCNGLSSGSYLLTAYDDHDRIIATTTISKQ